MAAKLVELERQAWKPIAAEGRLTASSMPVSVRVFVGFLNTVVFMFWLSLITSALRKDSTTRAVKLLKRYVDDNFAAIKKGHEDSFLHHLNGLFTGHIRFTIGKEQGNYLPFLDALVIKDGHKLMTRVHRKLTNTD
ncbi:hypothetical protein M514_11638 [Trichuris suis]|uniref:Uncharacterized protein n=1 Tax=Trichuris suis TaxID=68888 RepID=A0A085LR81_9BILA|nr:hypothetical protein M513_11638 [Trichuris suis]KFD63954.1 hypothetical protein M514_11638 [Trichuris suis]